MKVQLGSVLAFLHLDVEAPMTDRSLQAIRRSIKGEKSDSKPHHISITPKSAIAILPPKKVGIPEILLSVLCDFQS